jgi:PAS domain S-box-containing protein
MDPTPLAKTRALAIALTIAAVLVFPAAWLLFRTGDQEFAARQRATVSQRLGDVRAGLESALSTRLVFPRALAAFVASRPDLSQEAFAAFARDLVQDTPAIRSAQLARDNVVSHVYPKDDNPGVLGLSLPGDLPPNQAEAVRETLATGRPVLTGPVRLLQGREGLIVRMPVSLPGGAGPDGHGRLWGLATVIIDAEAFFREAGLPEARGIQLAIRRSGGGDMTGEIISGPASVFADAPVVTTIPLPGCVWELAAIPVGGWTGSPGRAALVGAALAVWLTLGLAIWTFLSWPVRLKLAVDSATAELAAARAGLEREVAERTRELRTANQALLQSETRYRAYLDATSDMVFLKDTSLRHIVANRNLAELFGITPEALVGRTDETFMPPDMAARCHTSDLAARDRQELVTDIETSNGRTFEVRKFPALLGDGSIGVGGVIRDVTDRLRAEEALRDSEETLRGLRDNAPIGIFTSTPDGRYLEVNACLAAMYGYDSPEEMLASVVNIQDQHYFDPDERDALMERIDAAGVLRDYETRRLTRSGKTIWVSLSLRALRDQAGTATRYEGFCTEITERKQTEEARLRQERQLRIIFENSPLGLIYFDARGNVVKCNARLLDQMGTTAERVEGKFLLPLYPEFIRRALQQALAGEPARAEGRYTSVTGGTGRPYVRVTFNPVEPGRRPSEVIATVEDITSQRGKDAELRLLWAAVEASPTSIVITGAKGDIEYVNPRFAELTGYTAAEAKGRNPSLLKSGIQPEAFYREMWETIAAGRIWRGEFCNRKKNGEMYWEDASISPIRDESGEISHFVAVKEDITERKKLETIREDVERIMRHDLKAPLNSIVNLPMVVAELGEVNEEQRELLAEIERVGQLMLEQINQSLDLYKMETGTFVPALQRVDLAHLTRAVVDMLASLARAREVAVTVEAASGQLFARADALLCQTVFGNLLKNAIEASGPGQTVTVRLRGGDRPQWIAHNPGEVAADIRPVFFEKYATSGKRDGNGLGTYSARLMIECQGGAVRLDSSAAAGTTLTVTLPGEVETPPDAEDQADHGA